MDNLLFNHVTTSALISSFCSSKAFVVDLSDRKGITAHCCLRGGRRCWTVVRPGGTKHSKIMLNLGSAAERKIKSRAIVQSICDSSEHEGSDGGGSGEEE